MLAFLSWSENVRYMFYLVGRMCGRHTTSCVVGSFEYDYQGQAAETAESMHAGW